MDLLSGGRLNPGVSVGPPMHYDQVKDALYPDTGDRMWYGGGLSSARWAGEHAMHFLTSSVVKAEESEDFAEIAARPSSP